MLNVHSLSTQKMPTSGELTDWVYDIVRVPGTSCSLLWIKRTVYSLANHFTQVDNQWQYNVHGATVILYTTKLIKHCCRCWMYIHCLPRKCRHPVNLHTAYMMWSKSLGLPVHYCGSKANSRRTVWSLANHFTQVDNQWQYDIHGATTILYAAKLNKHCCGYSMYIHCLPRKRRQPVN